MNKQLRDYQIRISKDGTDILKAKKILCLFMEVRTGKTATALDICKNFGAKRVLFITKIKAFTSIENDYWDFGYLGNFDLTIINRESLHKIETNDFDVVIIDEVHGYTSYPKPSKYHKDVKERFGNIPMIMLSGTPTPESYSQYYHLFTLSNHSLFKDYKNFYKWANEYVDIKLKYLGYAQVKDYSNARKKDFWHHIRYHILTFTQEQAGFSTDVKENILKVKMKPITYAITERLIKDLVVTSKSSGKQIIADTGVKLQQKIHQLFSGTIKYEDGSTQVIDDTKACFIKHEFQGKKIAIFYNFVAELDMLKQTFETQLTTDLNEFNATDKNIALQIVSGREGISLAKADYLIFLNLQFSAVSYFQAKDRLTTMDRKSNDIYWIFAENGIEEKIYQSVMNKRDYTLKTFNNDFRTTNTKENNKPTTKRGLALHKTN
ncbi:DEXDc domain containing protein [uncultured Caudovirales phage]|uniref:DEXDc domain containing protein n=1 Tax=uncultured Caudovirales phage TaxID=2100421 RepID=A0A6J5N0C0_9CAUD|nr:DEXDc domain containing protein [uncultured Caudovirales phage]CAB4152072.1 DEXDc domain containing protein [uncultured Caudovirales phage]